MKAMQLPIRVIALVTFSLLLNSCVQAENSQPSVNKVVFQNAISQAENFQPGVNKVTFQSEGEKMVGNLYLPANYKSGDKIPIVLVTGSWTTVKEQMADLYAKRLMGQGLAAMTFDFRFFGESGGKPRQYESPSAKIQDIKNAATYLQSLPMVDANRIGGLGVCASAGYMAHAIAQGAPIKSFVTVAAWLHDPQTVKTVYQGEAGVQRRIQLAKAARQKYEQTGKVEYVPAASNTDRNAAMFNSDYYSHANRGEIPQWKNQFAVMSWSEWLQFNALAAAPNVRVPTLFVHTDKSAFPDNVRRFYNTMPGPKDLFWTQGVHSDFYDRDPYVTKAVQAATDHFKDTLFNTRISER